MVRSQLIDGAKVLIRWDYLKRILHMDYNADKHITELVGVCVRNSEFRSLRRV